MINLLSPPDKPVIEVEIDIPSELGYEKVAMVSAAAMAHKVGFATEKVEDLKTAISEACTNAIEHGNAFDVNCKVRVILTVDDRSLTANVIDEGHNPMPDPIPGRAARPDFRGMGLYLIQMLMDNVEVNSRPGRNEIRMTSFFTPPLAV